MLEGMGVRWTAAGLSSQKSAAASTELVSGNIPLHRNIHWGQLRLSRSRTAEHGRMMLIILYLLDVALGASVVFGVWTIAQYLSPAS